MSQLRALKGLMEEYETAMSDAGLHYNDLHNIKFQKPHPQPTSEWSVLPLETP